MTVEDLEASGYSSYKPSVHLDRWDVAYSKRFWKGVITDYFIHVHVYRLGQSGKIPEGKEVSITANHGCAFFPGDAALRILIYAGCDQWTIHQMETCCAEMMKRLEVVPYEQG